MKKTIILIDKLLSLANGESLPDSSLQGEWFHEMQADGILIAITHGSRKSWRACNVQSLRSYLAEKYELRNLEDCRKMLENETPTRSGLVEATGDSKFVRQRSFMGFLVNTFNPIEAQINGKTLTIAPTEGTFTYIFDYQNFVIPKDVIVVGIENAENFRNILDQRTFFEENISSKTPLLFASRYPQNGDLVRWLLSITNHYVHFGDLDLAGIHIYLSEFYKYIGERSSFLIPHDYVERISKGSHQRYDNQYEKFSRMKITDSRVQTLVNCINRLHRGYDQEGFIKRNTPLI